MKSACFTGHRSFTGDTTNLEARLYDILERVITKKSVTDFYVGGAVGWDELAAKTVLKLRNVYTHIRLHLILPCSNDEQTAKWTEKQKTEFYRILDLADTVEYTSEYYYNGCMKVRNARLVELANFCFCFWDTNRQQSGTAQTVRMAQRKKIMIVNFFRSVSLEIK
ncbi:MAG: SLOG family protein [Clostridium sp.]|nr:SLOG family protein [Clostridium sp.]